MEDITSEGTEDWHCTILCLHTYYLMVLESSGWQVNSSSNVAPNSGKEKLE